VQVTLAAAPGEQLVAPGAVEAALDLRHEPGADAAILKIGMDDPTQFKLNSNPPQPFRGGVSWYNPLQVHCLPRSAGASLDGGNSLVQSV
jgi:hypothetical protein